MKPEPVPRQREGTPFEKFDRLFRKEIAVPKAAIDKQEAKWKRRQERRRAKKSV
jgi:hypothetical protein